MRSLSFAFRSLRRSPGFAAVAIVSLALALGLSTAVFAIIDSVRHPRSAFRQPEQLFTVVGRGEGAAGRIDNAERIRALQDRLPSTQGMALHGYTRGGLAEAGTRFTLVDARTVSLNFFELTGVRPVMGRVFTSSTVSDDIGRSAVISHRLWRRLFAGDERLEQLAFTLDSRTYGVVGVAPPVLGSEHASDVYLPLLPEALDSPTDSRYLQPVVRLREGATLQSLNRDLAAAARYLKSVHGVGRIEFGYRAFPIKRDPLELTALHWVLLAAALSVLLIACGNLANLVLARGLARQRDMAVRLSLGARRATVVQEILAECVLLALAGAALGLLSATWGLDLVTSRLPDRVPFLGALVPQFSWRVLALATAAALGSAALFGIFPALRLSDLRLTERLHDNAGTTTGRTHGRYSALVAAQVALALTLLTGATLLMRASEHVRRLDFGYDARSLIRLYISADRRGDTSRAAMTGYFHGMRARVEALAGVQSLAWSSPEGTDGHVTADLGAGRGRPAFLRAYGRVSPGYLRTLGIPMVEGRDFEESDALGDGVVIVDQVLARRLWRYDSPVGRMIKMGDVRSRQPWLRVVGVARTASANRTAFDDDEPGMAYVVSSAVPWHRTFAVRARPADHARLGLAIDRAIRDATPSRQHFSVGPWNARHAELLATQRFLSRLFGSFGLVALLLCAIGLYSVLSYAVNQRTREYGIRMAIGASRREVFRVVLRDGAVLVLAGTAIGGMTSIWTNRLVDRYIPVDMYHVDPLALILAELVLVAVALMATAGPALRATRANPVDVLRAV